MAWTSKKAQNSSQARMIQMKRLSVKILNLRTNKKYKIGYQSNKKRFSKVKVIESIRRLAKDTTWKSSTFFHESTSHGAIYVWNRYCGRIDGGGASSGGGDPIEEKSSLSAICHIGARLIFRRFYLIFPCWMRRLDHIFWKPRGPEKWPLLSACTDSCTSSRSTGLIA